MNPKEKQQWDLLEGIDPAEFAKAKMVQGLRNLLKESLLKPDAITSDGIEAVCKEKDEQNTIFSFILKSDKEKRVFCISLKNKPDGTPDLSGQTYIWQKDLAN